MNIIFSNHIGIRSLSFVFYGKDFLIYLHPILVKNCHIRALWHKDIGPVLYILFSSQQKFDIIFIIDHRIWLLCLIHSQTIHIPMGIAVDYKFYN